MELGSPAKGIKWDFKRIYQYTHMHEQIDPHQVPPEENTIGFHSLQPSQSDSSTKYTYKEVYF